MKNTAYTSITKKVIGKITSLALSTAITISTFPIMSVNVSADTEGFPLPSDGKYTVTVLSRYSSGVNHDSYIGEWILGSGAESLPDSVMDIAASKGTPIYAVADGVIHQNNNHSAGGYNVVIKHDDGTYSYYGHMLSRSSLSKGSKVKRGDIIGYVGMTGNATGYHLHFEWSGHDPYCEFINLGYSLSNGTGAKAYPHNHENTDTDDNTAEEPYTAYAVNTDGSLAINSTASSKNMIGKIPEGASCTVYPEKAVGNWYYVSYNGISGYSYGKYLTQNAPSTYTGKIKGTDGSLAINSIASAGNMIGKIPEGASCTVYDKVRNGNWVWVSYNGVYGYASSKYIVNAAAENTYTAYATGTNGSLAINSAASSDNMIGKIPEGAAVTVYPDKSSCNWLYVSYKGVKGYSYGKYLTKTAPSTYTGKIKGTDGSLAINSIASAGYMIGKIPEGASCTVYDKIHVGNWVWVCYNGVYGYAYSKYIK